MRNTESITRASFVRMVLRRVGIQYRRFFLNCSVADPCLCLMDPDSDPDPAIFVVDLQDANKKLIVSKKFFCLLLFQRTFTSFFKDKK